MSELIRVTLLLDRDALEDLERIVRYRHGPASRSSVVREAVMWLRAREAAHLLAQHDNEERRARERAELEARRALGAVERQRLAVEDQVARALGITGRTAE